MRMFTKRGLVVLVCVLLGCGRAKRPPTPVPDADAENQATLAKLQGYIECLERSGRVFQISDAYTARFGATPPTVDGDVPLQAPEDPKGCLEDIAEANQLPPKLPELEAAAAAYGKALGDVFALTFQGRDYFSRASKTYAPAKGIALHGQLLAAFRAFDAAQGSLFDHVYRVNHAAYQHQLASREQREGRTLGVIAADMALRAEDLVRFASTPWDHLDQLDVGGLDGRIASYEAVFEELVAYGLANAGELTRSMPNYRNLSGHARAYLIAARQLARRARDKVPFTDAEKLMIASQNERAVVGTPAAMIDAYNRVAEAYSPL